MNRVILITGAASGIGRGLAVRFLASGERVTAFDCNAEGLERLQTSSAGSSQNLCCVAGDVSIEADVEACIAQTQSRFGPVEVLINNAGIAGGERATVLHMTPAEDFDRVLAVNVRGAYLMSRAVLPGMIERAGGVIINIASVAGLVAFPGRAAYTAAKGALVQLTRSITADYARFGIRAVALCPGMIETPLTQWRLDQPHLRQEILNRIPQGTIGTIADVVNAVSFLAGPEAAYFNGAALPMDGGLVAI
jgi:NAD(P)-dependent dehydrogenase (short-subunit alcohol dehydrogenase family)